MPQHFDFFRDWHDTDTSSASAFCLAGDLFNTSLLGSDTPAPIDSSFGSSQTESSISSDQLDRQPWWLTEQDVITLERNDNDMNLTNLRESLDCGDACSLHYQIYGVVDTARHGEVASMAKYEVAWLRAPREGEICQNVYVVDTWHYPLAWAWARTPELRMQQRETIQAQQAERCSPSSAPTSAGQTCGMSGEWIETYPTVPEAGSHAQYKGTVASDLGLCEPCTVPFKPVHEDTFFNYFDDPAQDVVREPSTPETKCHASTSRKPDKISPAFYPPSSPPSPSSLSPSLLSSSPLPRSVLFPQSVPSSPSRTCRRTSPLPSPPTSVSAASCSRKCKVEEPYWMTAEEVSALEKHDHDMNLLGIRDALASGEAYSVHYETYGVFDTARHGEVASMAKYEVRWLRPPRAGERCQDVYVATRRHYPLPWVWARTPGPRKKQRTRIARRHAHFMPPCAPCAPTPAGPPSPSRGSAGGRRDASRKITEWMHALDVAGGAADRQR